MLIRSIRAENFRRFEQVEIEKLPEYGLIGIEGPNESGKSTLGELLLFAFFGRARGESDAPVSSLIRWGAESLRVEVEFLVRRLRHRGCREQEDEASVARDRSGGEPPIDAGEFMIYREIDRRGSNLVKVLRLPEREEVAVGAMDVKAFVTREIRFDFEEFQRSFYHGQLEKRRWADSETQSDEVDFLEVATGIAYLRAAIRKARASSREHEERFAQVQMELERNRAQIERHDRNVQKIPALTEKLADLEARIAEKNSVVSSGRDDMGQLRAEARRLERRAVTLDAAAEGVVSEVAGSVRKALEEDRAACTPRLYGQAEWESALRKARDAITRVDAFLRDFLELRTRLEERADEIAEEIAPEDVEGAPAEFAKREGDAESLGASLRRLRVFSSILLLLTALAGGATIAMWQGVLDVAPELNRTVVGVCGVVTGVFLFLSAWCLAQAGAAKRRWRESRSALETVQTQLDALRAEQQALKGLLDAVAVPDVRSAVERACRLEDKRVRKRSEEFRARHQALLETDGDERLEAVLEGAAKLDRELKGQLHDAAQKAKKKLAGNESSLKKLIGDRDRVASELRECRSQERKKVALQEKNFGAEVAANAARSEVAKLLQAIDLLEESIVSIRTRVRPAVAAYLKTVLPRLTGDRYRDLKVEENLEIKVFSSAKGDFLAVPELSGGTGEALGLSLRLALSQAFVMARIGQAQFVFLDEPFKMMDGARSVATLCALEELSAELRQIFVAQPDFDPAERDRCTYLIRTDGDSERLHAVPRFSEDEPRNEEMPRESEPETLGESEDAMLAVGVVPTTAEETREESEPAEERREEPDETSEATPLDGDDFLGPSAASPSSDERRASMTRALSVSATTEARPDEAVAGDTVGREPGGGAEPRSDGEGQDDSK